MTQSHSEFSPAHQFPCEHTIKTLGKDGKGQANYLSDNKAAPCQMLQIPVLSKYVFLLFSFPYLGIKQRGEKI